ncbi:MAG: hypothetical protein ACK46X_07270 [Candidatus Sericytochromatia bacterium]
MPLRRSWPLVALLIAGCDPQLVQVLGDLVGPEVGMSGPGGPGASASSAPAPVPSASPAREAYAPLDLSAQTWVPEQPDTYRIEGDRITVPARQAEVAHLFYRPALGDTFTLSFTERRASVNGDLTVWWMLDRADMLDKDAEGQPIPNGENKLTLYADGRCLLKAAGKTQAERKVTGPRTWRIDVRPGHATVTLNGDVLADYPMAPGYHPAPFLAFTSTQRKQAQTVIEDVTVTSNAPGARHVALRQWSMAGKGVGVERFNLLYPADLPKMPPPAELDTYPPLLPHVVGVGGYPLDRIEGLTYARTDRFSGGTHTSGGVMLSTQFCKASSLSAHELAHGFGAAGSQKTRSGEGWLVEGFANYLGFQAFNRYNNLPDWRTPKIGELPSWDPPLGETKAETTARHGAESIAWQLYGKGRIYFALLAAHTSTEDVRATIVAAKDVDRLTGERFVQLLEARTGKDLSALRPGWLTPGPYRGVAPKDANDTDKDGLLDFQELAWNTDPAKRDTDADGVSDFDERARGTDARVAGAPIPGLAGFAPGSRGPGSSDAEPAPIPGEVETPVEP